MGRHVEWGEKRTRNDGGGNKSGVVFSSMLYIESGKSEKKGEGAGRREEGEGGK